MTELSTFQRNNIVTGTDLAAEIQASSSQLRAFVVIGAYKKTSRGFTRPLKTLNAEQRDLLFWLWKYEVNKNEVYLDIVEEELLNAIRVDSIEEIEQLEEELKKYIQDFSIMKAAWNVDNPLP